jgi:hypothetical protein
MATALGVATPRRSLPAIPARLLAIGMEGAARWHGTPAPLTRPRVRALSSRCLFRSERLSSIGFELPFGYRDGLGGDSQLVPRVRPPDGLGLP